MMNMEFLTCWNHYKNTKVENRKAEGMYQFHTWKCHNENPCILKKYLSSFKIRGQEGKTGAVWGLVQVGGEKM
jgi:hypothetical protein